MRIRLLLGVAVILVLSALVAQATAATTATNDPYFSLQWGIQQINADEAGTASV